MKGGMRKQSEEECLNKSRRKLRNNSEGTFMQLRLNKALSYDWYVILSCTISGDIAWPHSSSLV